VRTIKMASGLILTLLEVHLGARVTYQLYAGTTDQSLVGLFKALPDAMSAVEAWRQYLAHGGGLAAWLAAHPDGVQPNEQPTAEPVSL
jgi:hypothetical protein